LYAPKIRYVKEYTGEISKYRFRICKTNTIRNNSSAKEDLISTVEAIWALCKNGEVLPQLSLVS